MTVQEGDSGKYLPSWVEWWCHTKHRVQQVPVLFVLVVPEVTGEEGSV
jgi:hypothetical protein